MQAPYLPRRFAWLSRWIAGLPVSRKLMLIYVLDLTVVLLVSGFLVNEKFIAIDFARKELSGNAFIGELQQPWLRLAQAGGEPPGEPAAALRTTVERLDASHRHALLTGEPAAALVAELSAPAAAGAAPPDVRRALALARALATRVANQSNLILDPDLDSYYTMSLVALRYPELPEIVEGIRVELERLSQAGAAASPTAYLLLEGRLQALREAIAGDVAEAVTAGGPGLQRALEPTGRALDEAIARLQVAARDALHAQAPGGARVAFEARRVELLAQLGDTWAHGSTALSGLLEARIEQLYARMWLHLGVALVFLLLILAIVWLVAHHIAAPLAYLSKVMDEVRRSGDHGRRARWDSGDEIGRLVAGFNQMLSDLDREREAQKELAAAARAAAAERQLVEATPIALVLTAVPGHEVLHSNPPAEAWLRGRRSDPWRAGLEPEVRARFFQQLADRGFVEEFEVRWATDAGAQWAVLSARRIPFQGRDAVLTSFTPINHLKLMERRLQLWAKVFEASSEGIAIVDGERRIIAVNQALAKLVGQGQEELMGEPPALLHELEDADGWWRRLRMRGHWQGELVVHCKDGSRFPAWMVASVVRQSSEEISHYILTAIDISDRKRSEQRIRYLAHHDVLTGLPNRSLCMERMKLAVDQARRSGQLVALLFIDLDRFKDINDSLGHPVGDGLLRSVARRLTDSARSIDTVARLGGDEFLVIVNGVDDAADVATIVEQRLIPLVRQPHRVDGAELHVSCSVGAALFPDDATDLDELMRLADIALYEAKAAGKDTFRFFSPEMTVRTHERRATLEALRQALPGGQLLLHWQPRVDARTRGIVGAEALLRWQHPERGLVPPVQFIGVAEESGLIGPIGEWVVDEACRQAAAWRGDGVGDFVVSVNLSAAQLRDDRLVPVVRGALQRHGLPGTALELELTESMVMENAARTLGQMQALRQLGVALAIDDFGTGYSSLAYLNRFPIDKLKIDRSFVHDLLVDETDRALTLAIVGLGHTLGLAVVAEGVEHDEQARVLEEAGCDELQGYLFARPMPAPQLAAWLQRQGPHPQGSSAAADRAEEVLTAPVVRGAATV